MPTLTKPELTENRIAEIKSVMDQNPEVTRTQLSKLICTLWEWKSPTGVLKDISCRDMLRKLDKAGTITLPPPLCPSRSNGGHSNILHLKHDMTPIECSLKDLLPLHIGIPLGGNETAQFKSYLSQFHYLSYDRTIGENIKYIVKSNDGRVLACLLFGSVLMSPHSVM